ncbi:MAG: hypothetical protein RL030_1317 [Pseudomonadota bacterium]|jgi:uncharacterized iron-regulated membrane protein
MTSVPGSLFRRTLFWAHLCCGIAAGVLVLVMSVTGVLLAYERQIIQSRQQANRIVVPAGAQPLDVDRVVGFARDAAPPEARISMIFDADPAMPVVVSMGRDQQLLLNPLTGELLPDHAANAREFFHVVEGWHRWLGGDSRGFGSKLIDISNLLFVFLILSGIYLWLPAVWRWRTVRGLVLFQKRYVNAKVRDFNWHHVFSFWMLIPLFLIALSGVVMSYAWANRAVFAIYGETPPQRGGPGGPGAAGERANSRPTPAADGASYATLMSTARSQFSGWQRITLPVDAGGNTVQLTAELVSRELRAPRQTLVLSRADASVVELSPPPQPGPGTQSRGQRARVWLRFVHTGEQYGLTGQTLAAIASLAACFLVYTGLALAWRRLIRPLFRRTA